MRKPNLANEANRPEKANKQTNRQKEQTSKQTTMPTVPAAACARSDGRKGSRETFGEHFISRMETKRPHRNETAKALRAVESNRIKRMLTTESVQVYGTVGAVK
jgi:hypothetical protein